MNAAQHSSPALFSASVLETLTQGFGAARERLSGVRKLNEENVAESLRDVRMSLLEADVDLSVVRDFLAGVKERALGDKVETRVRDATGRMIRISPGQHFVKACQEELVALMGPVDPELSRIDGRTSVMLVGLQGVGKTTVAGKLARYLHSAGRRPLLVAADVYRPAAVFQLQQLGEQLGVEVHAGAGGETPADGLSSSPQTSTAPPQCSSSSSSASSSAWRCTRAPKARRRATSAPPPAGGPGPRASTRSSTTRPAVSRWTKS